MDTSSINPASIIDETVDLSMRLAGTDFPVSIFPTKIQRIISEVHKCHNYPTDYIAAAILTAIAVGIGNTHLAQIKQGWIESPILYMALIGRPGANKSHPLSFAMKPFLDYDYQQNQVFEKALTKYDELMSMSRKERTESGEEQFPQEPVRKRFLISDVTPEGLSLIHAQNIRLVQELQPLQQRFGRTVLVVSVQCQDHYIRPQERQEFHLHQATVYFGYWHYPKEDS